MKSAFSSSSSSSASSSSAPVASAAFEVFVDASMHGAAKPSSSSSSALSAAKSVPAWAVHNDRAANDEDDDDDDDDEDEGELNASAAVIAAVSSGRRSLLPRASHRDFLGRRDSTADSNAADEDDEDNEDKNDGQEEEEDDDEQSGVFAAAVTTTTTAPAMSFAVFSDDAVDAGAANENATADVFSSSSSSSSAAAPSAFNVFVDDNQNAEANDSTACDVEAIFCDTASTFSSSASSVFASAPSSSLSSGIGSKRYSVSPFRKHNSAAASASSSPAVCENAMFDGSSVVAADGKVSAESPAVVRPPVKRSKSADNDDDDDAVSASSSSALFASASSASSSSKSNEFANENVDPMTGVASSAALMKETMTMAGMFFQLLHSFCSLPVCSICFDTQISDFVYFQSLAVLVFSVSQLLLFYLCAFVFLYFSQSHIFTPCVFYRYAQS